MILRVLYVCILLCCLCGVINKNNKILLLTHSLTHSLTPYTAALTGGYTFTTAAAFNVMCLEITARKLLGRFLLWSRGGMNRL